MKGAFPRGSSQKITFAHRMQYAALRLFIGAVSIGPRAVALWWARRWGDIAFEIIRIRRGVTLENLRCAFPDREQAWILRVARSAYRNFAMTMIEVGLLNRFSKEDILKRQTAHGEMAFDVALERGSGGVLLSAHFGNWEYLGGYFALRGYPINFLVRSQRNRLVDEFLNKNRRRLGVGIIPVGPSVRLIYKHLRANECVAFLLDQDAGHDGRFFEFLGRPASFATGPILFARRTGASILIGYGYRRPGGRFVLEIEPPIETDPDLSEDEDVDRITRLYIRHLEGVIRRFPEQWFWMHRRWKTSAV
ncbi:MAG: lysophospholipid acyltransferase family protein [Candidatus Eisenbacteria bacterium]|uniref:Lysophospholipid acyltransferase family protein n=1 Tax=Eiseniibacteriota bacterium TaxID=2212470 RepID=A0A948RZG2_UNCEI|nr:lysophospholipid acyltransferase family protein [Candidatus Eisenbacteria bacterium]MBU1947357.1 lysophospholipid acyltransferase family protein [Candidatus Eisenbacteria bacterium]MBU2692462.1 lysophospholipid acyltransferase family protein [Candidatus Eisenbacteria bacterium]